MNEIAAELEISVPEKCPQRTPTSQSNVQLQGTGLNRNLSGEETPKRKSSRGGQTYNQVRRKEEAEQILAWTDCNPNDSVCPEYQMGRRMASISLDSAVGKL